MKISRRKKFLCLFNATKVFILLELKKGKIIKKFFSRKLLPEVQEFELFYSLYFMRCHESIVISLQKENSSELL